MPDPRRNKDLARIHIAKEELGMDEETYRALLKNTTGKASAADLTPGQRWRVLCEMGRLLGNAPAPSADHGKPTRVPKECQALVGKIEALLADAKRPWAYAHAMAKRMYKRESVQDCEPKELHGLVAALEADAKRRKQA